MRKIIKPVFILVFIVAHVFILRNIILLSKDVIYGDLSGNSVSAFSQVRPG